MKPLTLAALALLAILQSPNADEIRSRLHAYLLEYEPKLSELIADEVLVQQDRPSPGDDWTPYAREGEASNYSGPIGPAQYRTLRSEVAFIALPGGAGWLGFRRVAKVGGNDVESASSLRDVLPGGSQDDYAKARAMLADSARFNLGAPRTTNLPNLPLELLHPRNAGRFTVRIAGKEKVRGKNTTRLVFVEVVTPTIIQAVDGGDMRSIVAAWVETENGRLWRAEVTTRDTRPAAPAFDALVAVDFRENATLRVMTPTAMRENFFAGPRRRAWGEASYSNYRRFQTSARIVPPPP